MPTETFYSLNLSWSVSRGRDTYGYNICRLDDTRRYGQRYRCNGGGYDMVGTVLGEFLADQYQYRLKEIKNRAPARGCTDSGKWHRFDNNEPDTLYGMFWNMDKDRVLLDGACGVNSMIKVAEAIGLEISYKPTVGRSRTSNGFYVRDLRAEDQQIREAK